MYLIVTNNPMAAKEFAGQGEVRLYPEDTYREILVRARDLVYIGHRLCNHPLYGSLRPHETPYRTVVLSDRPQTPDGEECLIMSEAITRIDTFTPGSGEDAPAYSGGLSDDRLLSGEEYLRLLRGAYEKRRTAPDTYVSGAVYFCRGWHPGICRRNRKR